MAGFNLGAFAGGIGSGLEQGQDIRERYRKMAEEQQQKMEEGVVARIRSANLLQGTPLNPPSNGGNAPIGGTPPMPAVPPPQQMALPNVQPMPNTGGPPPAQARAQPPPIAPQPPAPPAQGPQGPPGGAAPPGGGMTPQPVQHDPGATASDPQAQMMQMIAQAKKQNEAQIKTMYQQVMAAGGDEFRKHPEMAFRAVEMMIKQNTELDESDKTTMLMENKLLSDQLGLFKAYQAGLNVDKRVGAEERGQDIRHGDTQDAIAERWAAVKATNGSREKIAAARDATEMQAAELRASTQEDINQKVLDFRKDALDAGLDEKTWQAQLSASLKNQGMSDAFIDKVFAAQAGASTTGAPPAPKRPMVGQPAPPQRRTAGATSGAPPIPPSTEGMKATSPSGQKWVVKGGKWVQG